MIRRNIEFSKCERLNIRGFLVEQKHAKIEFDALNWLRTQAAQNFEPKSDRLEDRVRGAFLASFLVRLIGKIDRLPFAGAEPLYCRFVLRISRPSRIL